MTREVLIRISGLQMMASEDEADDVEMITTGDYFRKNGKHYIIYDEVMDGLKGISATPSRYPLIPWTSANRESQTPTWSLSRTKKT